MQDQVLATQFNPKSANKYHVYFQPGQNVQLYYPAIVYERDRDTAMRANNELYTFEKVYRITVIDRDPDSKIPDAVRKLRKTSYLGHNRTDGLNHDIYAISF